MAFPAGQQQQPPAVPSELFLRYPENIGIHPQIVFEQAVNLLVQAVDFSQRAPFAWTYIDKPPDGQAYLIFSANPNLPLPCDGIRWLESEKTFRIPANGRELEVGEVKFGFVPGAESFASRMRRKYRLTKGGNPGLILIHYLRAEQTAIPNPVLNAPVRNYPLRQVNEPRIFVAGDRIGQRVPSIPAGSVGVGVGVGGVPIPQPPPQQSPQANGMPISAVGSLPIVNQASGMPQQQPPHMNMNINMNMGLGLGIAPAALAQHTQAFDTLERERRSRMVAAQQAAVAGGQAGNIPGAAGAVAGVPPGGGRPVEEDDSADEHETVTTRALAIERFRRNHELMSDIFYRASQGKRTPKSHPSPYASLSLSDMTAKIDELSSEVTKLESESQRRRMARDTVLPDSDNTYETTSSPVTAAALVS